MQAFASDRGRDSFVPTLVVLYSSKGEIFRADGRLLATKKSKGLKLAMALANLSL